MLISAELSIPEGTVRISSPDRTPLHRGSGVVLEINSKQGTSQSFNFKAEDGLFRDDESMVMDEIFSRNVLDPERFVANLQEGVVSSFNSSPRESRTPELREGIMSSIIKLRTLLLDKNVDSRHVQQVARQEARHLFPMSSQPHAEIDRARDMSIPEGKKQDMLLVDVVRRVRTAFLPIVQTYNPSPVPDLELTDLSLGAGVSDNSEARNGSIAEIQKVSLKDGLEHGPAIQKAADVSFERRPERDTDIVPTKVKAVEVEDEDIYSAIDQGVSDMEWDTSTDEETADPDFEDDAIFTPTDEDLEPGGFGDPTLDETRPERTVMSSHPPVPLQRPVSENEVGPNRIIPIVQAKQTATSSHSPVVLQRPISEDEEIPDFVATSQKDLFSGVIPDIPDSLDFDDPDFR